ncbi:NAD-dependent protein deacetylase sirtuin-3, mitochondrial isoform X3 [Girardinichthys multiradiatus]|uniref:NAD-dependent protein deacetylase sirtuin-3, mitochondrial isoform X3 n=1 Tax=Girardinichthys multiradiatus TaxID=208333 RepID=UPI001FAD158F|nr:NAD-dependent protein deacetylase sirtuin-3, mitochondrial isoform X3 [Girardinichthys multiradiatus]
MAGLSVTVRLCCLDRRLSSGAARTIRAKGFGPRSLHLYPVERQKPLFQRIISRGLFSRGEGESVQPQTLQDVAKNIQEQRYRRVVVMAGAGISTPSGIPDFSVFRTCRSPGSGLYDNLQQYDLPYAEAIFEIGFFHRNPNPFFALAKELYPVAGVPPEMLVEAHGTFATATCTLCLQKYDGEDLRPAVMSGTVPQCPTCKGVVKPDIVFFGEELPLHFFKYLTDFPLVDLLIIMGTSLEVEPFASLAGAVRSTVPRLLINRDLVGPFAWGLRPHDVVQLGDVVGGVKTLVDALGWTRELEALMAAGNQKVCS